MTKNVDSAKAATVSSFGIVNKIMAFLKLDEAGKIEKFFTRELKKIETYIRDLKNNLIATQNTFESALQKIDDSIEDAKEGVVAAEQNITEADVKTNEACDSFSSIYWSRIQDAENRVERLEKKREELIKANEEDIKKIKEQIAKYELRIARIKA